MTRAGSGQVSSPKAYFKPPTIATSPRAQSPKAAQVRHFRVKQKPPIDKISFINRWYLIWHRY